MVMDGLVVVIVQKLMSVRPTLRLTCYEKLFTLAIWDAVRWKIDSKLLQLEGTTEMKRDLWRSMSELALTHIGLEYSPPRQEETEGRKKALGPRYSSRQKSPLT
jgi:hypothetical protein